MTQHETDTRGRPGTPNQHLHDTLLAAGIAGSCQSRLRSLQGSSITQFRLKHGLSHTYSDCGVVSKGVCLSASIRAAFSSMTMASTAEDGGLHDEGFMPDRMHVPCVETMWHIHSPMTTVEHVHPVRTRKFFRCLGLIGLIPSFVWPTFACKTPLYQAAE